MIRSVCRTHDGHIHSNLNQNALAEALQDKEGLLVVDLVGEPVESCAVILSEIFSFHPLAIDDALAESHVPKVDDWGDYLYIVLNAIVFDERSDPPLLSRELDIFLGRNYLVIYEAQPIETIDHVWRSWQRDERHLNRGAEHLLYQLADALVADYMPAVDRIDEAIDEVEDLVFGRPTPDVLERIFALKRALLHLRRVLAPQREVLNKLSRGDYAVINASNRIFYRDVYDHLVRLYDITESLRDLTGSALDTYLSVVSNRMNDVMKTLTVITTLFMPLAFVAGFFGMNFFQPAVPLDVWTGEPAFVLTIAGMAVIPVFMYLWMRRRAWL
jgi:magnesium transporter